MAEIRQGRIITLLCVLFISCSTVDGNDDNTTVKNLNACECYLMLILHCVATVAAGIAAINTIVILVVVVIYYRRSQCCTRCQQGESCDPPKGRTSSKLTESDLTKGSISNVELWKLVQYSGENNENDILSGAISQLTTDTDTNSPAFQRLCCWNTTFAGTEQMDKLFKACLQVEMGETVQKLKEFRSNGSEVVSEYDLEHILWQIGNKSSENITTLLSKLTKSPFNQDSSLSENVRRALPELLKWTKGYHDINPAVILSLQSDGWCDEHMYFFTVSEEEKVPLKDAEIKEHVRNVSKAHCQKIISISSSKGKSNRNQEGKDIDTILDENETDLFNTYQMIKEWLDKQKCSNYEKRNSLRSAVQNAKEASTSYDINLGEIKQLASSEGNAEAAYELLMKDIKPFALLLGLNESELTNYKQQSSSYQRLRGTIGLVADVKAIKGKK